jgi:hypothetical protein
MITWNKALSAFSSKIDKNPVSIAAMPAEILTEHHKDTSLECYCYADPAHAAPWRSSKCVQNNP